MKSVVYSVFTLILLTVSSARAEETIVATATTIDGAIVRIMAAQTPDRGDAYLRMGEVWAETGGKKFRIADEENWNGILLKAICAPYKADYPYTYNTAEIRKGGLFGSEKVLEVNSDGLLLPSNADTVVGEVDCAKSEQ